MSTACSYPLQPLQSLQEGTVLAGCPQQSQHFLAVSFAVVDVAAMSMHAQRLLVMSLVSQISAVLLCLPRSESFMSHFAWLENSLPVAHCLGSLNLNWVFLMVVISCTSGCDNHLRYAVPAQSGSTRVVRTGSSVSCALNIAHLRAFSMSFASYSGLACDDPCHL